MYGDHRVPDFAIGNSSKGPFSVGGRLRPPTPLRKVGLRPPGAARSPQPGPQGPKTSFGIVDLELFGPNGKIGKIGKIGKSKRGLNGPQMGPFGLKLCPYEAECLPGPIGSPPGPFWAHFWPKNPKNPKNRKIQKNSEIWNLDSPHLDSSWTESPTLHQATKASPNC